MSFGRDLELFAKKTNTNMITVVREFALAMGTSLIYKSPVDTGRFRGNWMWGLSVPNTRTDGPNDKSGGLALDRMISGAKNMALGQQVFITNSLPYAQRLEYGWSKQAPAGMVRLTVREYRHFLKTALEHIK